MKKIYQMRKLLPLILMCFALQLSAQGPDAYGYTWKDSNAPDGPVAEFVDISTIGTEVTGLTDDNSVALIDMGMSFHYYWLDFTQIKIGSNGWLSFNNVANISHCFPALPSPGGNGDNLVCPMMSDLNFAGAGNPGRVYYHNDGNGNFIVSYHEAPFWVNANPAYSGSNTFQVIFSQADSSITFQYLAMDDALANDVAGCLYDTSVGFENVTGNIGLQILSDAIPPDNYAIKIDYPEVVTFSVPDASPQWNQNAENGGEFYLPTDLLTLSTEVSSTGNADIETDITVEGELTLNGGTVFSATETISSLTAGMSQNVVFTDDLTDLAPGQYALEVSTSNPEDLNPGNNDRVSEISVVDLSDPDRVVLTYATGGLPTGIINWGSGDMSGAGIHVIPPAYPTNIFAVEVYIGQGSIDPFIVQLIDDDGVDGSPGTVLASTEVAAGNYTADSWNTVVLEGEIEEGSFYIGWLQGGNTVTLGTETAGPISNRTLEILSATWAEYRESTTTDFLIRVFAENNYIIDNVAEEVLQSQITLYPNPTDGLVKLSNHLEGYAIDEVRVYNSLGQLMELETGAVPANATQTFDFSAFAKGVYFVNLLVDGQQISKRLLVD